MSVKFVIGIQREKFEKIIVLSKRWNRKCKFANFSLCNVAWIWWNQAGEVTAEEMNAITAPLNGCERMNSSNSAIEHCLSFIWIGWWGKRDSFSSNKFFEFLLVNKSKDVRKEMLIYISKTIYFVLCFGRFSWKKQKLNTK